ncbi:hypothetical protein D3C75_1172840 [compost metagenome]
MIRRQYGGFAFSEIDQEDRLDIMLLSFFLEIVFDIGCCLFTLVQCLLGIGCVHVLVCILGCGSQILINLRHYIVVDRVHRDKVKADAEY